MEFLGANICYHFKKETILFNLFLVLPEKILNPKKGFPIPISGSNLCIKCNPLRSCNLWGLVILFQESKTASSAKPSYSFLIIVRSVSFLSAWTWVGVEQIVGWRWLLRQEAVISHTGPFVHQSHDPATIAQDPRLQGLAPESLLRPEC